MDYNKSNNWAYEPKKFKGCKVGDEVLLTVKWKFKQNITFLV